MGRPRKVKQAEPDPKEEAAIPEAQLREILMPFAEWAWGNKEDAQKVIDKYFKQVINK